MFGTWLGTTRIPMFLATGSLTQRHVRQARPDANADPVETACAQLLSD